MLIQLPFNIDPPEDYFIYAIDTTSYTTCGYTADTTSYLSYAMQEIPLNFHQVCIESAVEYLPIADIQSQLELQRDSIIDDIKTEINEYRTYLGYTHILFKDHLVKADAISQQDITDASLQAILDPTNELFPITWVTYNGYITMTAEEVIQLKTAISTRRKQLVYYFDQIKQTLETMPIEELLTYEIENLTDSQLEYFNINIIDDI